MADFGAWNSVTHSMVTLNDDVQLKNHGLEKIASYIVRKNGVYYEAIKGGTSSGAGTIAFGGADNAGTVDGTDAREVINACTDAVTLGGEVRVKAGIYTVDDYVNPFQHNNTSFIMENGAWLKAGTAYVGAVLANTDTKLHCSLIAYIDCNSEAAAWGASLVSLQVCNIEHIYIKDCRNITEYALALNTDGLTAGIRGVTNHCWNRYQFIHLDNCYNGISLEGDGVGPTVCTDNHFGTIFIDGVDAIGIRAQTYVDNNAFDFVYIYLDTNNAYGMKISDQVGYASVYGNYFKTVIIDPFNLTGTTGILFNYTALNTVDEFIWGQVSGTGGITGTPVTYEHCHGDQIKSYRETANESPQKLTNWMHDFDMIDFTNWSTTLVDTGVVAQEILLCELQTGVNVNSKAVAYIPIYIGGAASYGADYATTYEITWYIGVGASVATSYIYLKMDDDPDATDPSDLGVGFRIDNLDLKGQVYKTGTGLTTVNLSKALVPGTMYKLRVTASGGNIVWYCDDTPLGVSTDGPVLTLVNGQQLSMSVINGATASNRSFVVNRIIFRHPFFISTG